MKELFSTNVAYASFNSVLSSIETLIINPFINLLFALAIVYFLFGVFQFLSNQDNDEKKTIGKSHMMWGIIGIVIMLSVFTIMNMILNTLNIKGIKPEEGKVQLP